jgi:hypothetical protein
MGARIIRALLAVTCPLWGPLAIFALAIAVIGSGCWHYAGRIVGGEQ